MSQSSRWTRSASSRAVVTWRPSRTTMTSPAKRILVLRILATSSSASRGKAFRTIPYTVTVRCAGGYRGSKRALIHHPESSVVVTVTRHRGDHYTGESPRLAITFETPDVPKRKAEKQRWVTLAGLFLDYRESSQIDARDQLARFYDVIPGRYLLQVIEPQRLICTRQIDFLEAGASLLLSGDGSCTVRSAKSARVVE